MKQIIKHIKKRVLVKAISLKTVALLVKLVAGLLTSKAVAIFIGPVGFALIANLRNFVSSIQTISTLGFYNGVVKYVSDYKDNPLRLSRTISTIYYVGFISTFIVSFLCYYNAKLLNDLLFPLYNDYTNVIQIFAIVLPFCALNMFLFSIINGFYKYKILIVINIIGQVLSLSIALLLIYQRKIEGALISVVIAESLILLITLVGIINRRSLVPLIKVKNVSFRFLKKMSTYSLIAFFTTALLPLVAIGIRLYIIENVGYKEAGFWEAMTRISKYYLMVTTSLLALYITPKFSEIDNLKEFRKEVFKFYKTIVPILGVVLLIIFSLRKYIVSFVFTSEFKPVEDLFLWQLLGDFVKVLATIIAYQFLAKKMFWHYILTEAFLVIILYVTSIYFIDLYNSLKGVVVAYFVSYTMYFSIIILIFRTSFFGVDLEKAS